MKVYWSIFDVGDKLADAAVAIGNFDGIHLGHQAVINKAIAINDKSLASVLTFTPHPQAILRPGHDHFYLSNDEHRIDLFRQLGIEIAVIHKIARDFLDIEAHDFVKQLLVDKLRVRHVVIGDDFTFGKNALGKIVLLEELGKRYGFFTHVVSQVAIDGVRCSSSAIRNYLRKGDMVRANAMLGRRFSISGRVIQGQSLGKKLGFSTANIIPPLGFDLSRGVYATVVRVKRPDIRGDYISATNVGVRPTLDDESGLVIESHCLDRELDLYGENIDIYFVDKIRDEMKFLNLMALQEQVQKDCQRIRLMSQQNPDRFVN